MKIRHQQQQQRIEAITGKESDKKIKRYSNSLRLLGWFTVSSIKIYSNQKAFEDDVHLHCVKRSSGYGWKAGITEIVYGWVVEDYKEYSTPIDLEELRVDLGFPCEEQIRRSDNGPPNNIISKSDSTIKNVKPRKTQYADNLSLKCERIFRSLFRISF